MTALLLHRTNESGDLVPARFSQTLAMLSRIPGALPSPRATMRGQQIQLAVELSLDDDAGAAFLLDFPAQGARVSGQAHGPGAALLTWAFHALATSLKCRLVVDDEEMVPAPDEHRGLALAYLADYEAEVKESRRTRDDDAASFVAWLAREEHLALEKGVALPEELSLDDASALYEALLESDAVADVFVSEKEHASLLQRFRARGSLR